MADLRTDDTTPEETAEFEAMLAGEGFEAPKEAEPEEPAPKEAAPPAAEEPAEEPKAYQPKNEDEVRALATGIWVPKEEWIAAGKDPDDWVSARRFNLDGKKLKHVQELETRLNEYDRRSKAMLEHIQKQERAKYEARLKEMEDAKFAALEEGDVQRFRSLSEQQKKMEAAPPEVPAAPAEPEIPPEIQKFRSAIKDVHGDLEAIEVSSEFQEWMQDQPVKTFAAWMQPGDPREHIRILNEFKGRKARQIPARSPVEPPRPPSPAKPKQAGFNDLSHEQRRTYQEFVSRGMIQDSAEERAQFAKDCLSEAR